VVVLATRHQRPVRYGGSLEYNTGHFWSLAVEEQFYLVWPVVVWLIPAAQLLRVCVACAVVAFGLRLLSELTGHAGWAIALTPMRMDTLALGALLAAKVRLPGGLGAITIAAPWVGGTALAVLLATFFGSQRSTQLQPLHNTLGYSASALAYACLLALVIDGWADRVFSHPVLRFFGKDSYGLYVFHWPLLIFAGPLYGAVAVLPLVAGSSVLRQVAFFLGATTMSVAVAWLSWHLYEQRFLALKRYFPYKPLADRGTSPVDLEPGRRILVRSSS
jgi:peptidoglycan/LPS O-acetylase OafA/YrhL